MPLYATEAGQPITTHSMIKTFRRCPKQAEFKYVMRLKPNMLGTPLRRGNWMHALLEEHHKGGDWEIVHRRLCLKFSDLMDEEKDYYGDLPLECARLMRSYLWHYKLDEWKVLETEMTLETEFPDGTIYRGKIDALIENQYGLWIVDHKTHKRLPDLNFRLLDNQSALYLWAAERLGIPVQGFIWNYLRTKAPTTPALLKDGSRLSNRKCETDFVTMYTAIKRYGLDIGPYKPMLRALKAQRYQPGEPQSSPFFRRDVLEKSPEMLNRVAKAAFRTSRRMHTYYDRNDTDAVERVTDNGCTFNCSYTDICSMQLFGGNIRPLVKQRYKMGDPMDYYQDRAGEDFGNH